MLIDYLKRKRVTNEAYLVNLIIYVHHNARHHGFCSNGEDWEFSSLASFLSDGKTKLERDRIMKLFCGKELFREQHQNTKTEFDDEKEFLL